VSRKVDPNKVRFADRQRGIIDWEGQYDCMSRGYEVSVEKCSNPECGYDGEPTFREELRIAYRQVGEPGDYAYSRSISCRQEVLVCLHCNEVHKIVNEAF